jgi:alkanesulfonate monooxygenase SsuD/methylene tetrahydromethanopterin reductase-like flavin-dependent oxidoreductase (luciferase family)
VAAASSPASDRARRRPTYAAVGVPFDERWSRIEESVSMLRAAGRSVPDFPHALVTMWSFVTDSTVQADRVLREVLGPLLRRDPEDLRDQVCVGPAERCVDLLSRYARAGCRRVHFWPVGDERRQVELLAERVLPLVHR